MPLSDEAQALYDHARSSLPRWLTSDPSALNEWLYASAQLGAAVQAQNQEWVDETYLDRASPLALNQHALDRGTTRRDGESDDTLRLRLRTVTDVVTEPALLTGINQILDAAGQLAQFRFSPHNGGGWRTELQALHTRAQGGAQELLTLTLQGGLISGMPTLTETGNDTIIRFVSGATTRGDIENVITSSSTKFQIRVPDPNPITIIESLDGFTSDTFYLAKINSLRRDGSHFHVGDTLGWTPYRQRTTRPYLGTGHRIGSGSRPTSYVVMLPYGTNEPTRLAVLEYLRLNGPGGIHPIVERRENP